MSPAFFKQEALMKRMVENGAAPFLYQHHDLREILDPFCAEYGDSDIFEKQRIFQQFLDYGVSREELVEAYIDGWTRYGRPDIARAAEVGLRALDTGSLYL